MTKLCVVPVAWSTELTVQDLLLQEFQQPVHQPSVSSPAVQGYINVIANSYLNKCCSSETKTNVARINAVTIFVSVTLTLTRCVTITFIIEWWWLAVITPHWIHQLLTMGVDKYKMLCSKLLTNNSMRICVLVSAAIVKAGGGAKSLCWLALKRA